MRVVKYRIYPTKNQQNLLWKHANTLNWLYNYFLNQKIEAYKINKKNINRFDQQKQLVKLKKENDNLSNIYSQVLQQVPKRLNQSFLDFFRRVKLNKKNKSKDPVGYPKFRSCQKFFGITYAQYKSGYKILNDHYIKFSDYGNIKYQKHRPLNGNIKQLSIINEGDQWFVCITTDDNGNVAKRHSNKIIGIDIGLKHLVVSTDNLKIINESNNHNKYFDKQIDQLKSKIDKKKKGSNRRKYLSKIINRLYVKKGRKINDFLHKVSRTLANNYDTIFIEDLSCKKMSESNISNLNKAIRNAKIGLFINLLSYKVNNIIKVNPAYTSKMCNHCGFVHKDLKLSCRTISCQCGEVYDRDENAAKNIFCLGQAMILGSCTRSDTIAEAFKFI